MGCYILTEIVKMLMFPSAEQLVFATIRSGPHVELWRLLILDHLRYCYNRIVCNASAGFIEDPPLIGRHILSIHFALFIGWWE